VAAKISPWLDEENSVLYPKFAIEDVTVYPWAGTNRITEDDRGICTTRMKKSKCLKLYERKKPG
jgi:hypothetical protein